MKPPKSIGLARALELLRKPDHRLMLLHARSPLNVTAASEWYVVPGGYITAIEAQKILERPDVQPADNGLLPGCPQSWTLKVK